MRSAPTTRNNQQTFALAGLLVAACVCPPVFAKQPGYVTDSSDDVVRNSARECVHTSSWRPELGIVECGEKAAVAEAPAPEPAPPPPAPRPETITLDAKALFGFDKATLRPEARAKLDELARRITQQTKVHDISITGHADRIGSTDYNQRLSEERAQAVADYLQSSTDLRESKFQVRGVGESEPVVACEEQQGDALIDCLQPNRRVVIEVSAQQPAGSP